MRRRAILMTVMFGVLGGLTPALRQDIGGDSLSMLVRLCRVAPALAQAASCEDWEHGVIQAAGEAAAPDWATNPAQAEILAKGGWAGGTKVQQAITTDQEAATAVQGFIRVEAHESCKRKL
jgi:hypothetical protein